MNKNSRLQKKKIKMAKIHFYENFGNYSDQHIKPEGKKKCNEGANSKDATLMFLVIILTLFIF